MTVNAKEYLHEFDKIVAKCLGDNIDFSLTWEELGMSSIAIVQLRDSLQNSMAITLAPDCFDLNPSPFEMNCRILHS